MGEEKGKESLSFCGVGSPTFGVVGAALLVSCCEGLIGLILGKSVAG